MKTFASHTSRGPKGELVVVRRYRDHVSGVHENAQAGLYPNLDFGKIEGLVALASKYADTANGGVRAAWRAFMKQVVALHDIAKLTTYFQAYLKSVDGRLDFDRDLKGHTHFGALVAFDRLREVSASLAYFAAYLIAHHHQSLSQPGPGSDPLVFTTDEDRSSRMEIHAQQAAALPESGLVASLSGLDTLSVASRPLAKMSDAFSLVDVATGWRKRKGGEAGKLRGLDTFFCFNYFFSLLIEADKLDASATQRYQRRVGSELAVQRYLAGPGGVAPDLPPVGMPLSELRDERRNQARAEVLAHLDRDDILERKLFTLTAPTGLGKTLTGLDFALRLRGRLASVHAGAGNVYVPQIVVALPFINIVEQTVSVYRDVLTGDDIDPASKLRVLGHYQFADVLGQHDVDARGAGSEGEDSRTYDRARMSLDTWQADVVITTFVQLFQSIATGRNAALKKFNHLAGAILILDEVQSLPSELAPFVGTLIHYLTRCLDTRVIMMTATQPRMVQQANGILGRCGVAHRLEPLDLLPRTAAYFAAQQRTRLALELTEEQALVDDDSGSASEAFAGRFRESWTGGESQLIVVNTVNRSLQVFEALQDELSSEIKACRVLIFYLSTNVLPLQREERISVIKAALELARGMNGPRVVLVATQVVEAGVDLDFDRGWRDFGPVASLVQVAGRINREGRLGHTANLHVIRFAERQHGGKLVADAERVYPGVSNRASRTAFATRERNRYIEEADYLELTQIFFGAADEGIYTKSQELFEYAEQLNYSCLEKYFHLIEETTNTVSVYVPFGKTEVEQLEAVEALSSYRQLATEAMNPDARRARRAKFETGYGNAFRKRILNVPRRYADGLEPITPEADILVVPVAEVNDRYEASTGWKREFREAQLMIL